MGTKVAALMLDPVLKQAMTDMMADTANFADRLKSRMLESAGLVIFGAGSAIVKTGGSIARVLANGVLRAIAASTNMAALSGSVTNAKFNVYCFFIDSAGTLTTVMGTEGATLAAVVFPAFPAGKACIGFTIINPTGTGPFVGGTTALDDATVVPNAVHVSVTGPMDPNTTLNSIA
jgi:hypothetical protein